MICKPTGDICMFIISIWLLYLEWRILYVSFHFLLFVGKIMSLYNALSTGLNIFSPIYGSQLFTFYEVQEKSYLKGWLTAIHFLFAFFASLTLTRIVFNAMKLFYSKIRIKIDKNKKES